MNNRITEDEQAFADRALLDWARQAPQSPGYDEVLTEDQAAMLDYDRRKWMEQRPSVPSGYDDDSSIRVSGPGYSPSAPKRKKKSVKAKSKQK